MRIGPESEGYKTAQSSLIIASALFAITLFLELLFLLLGFSVLYVRLNTFQIMIHGVGVLCSLWMIFDSWRFQFMWVMFAFFGLIPSLMEMAVTFDAVNQSRRENKYQERMMQELNNKAN